MTKINLKKFKKAVDGSRGIVTVIARRMNVSRKAVYKYINRTDNARELIENEKEKIIDLTENQLMKRLNNNDWKAIRMILTQSKRGRQRGYGKRLELEHSGEINTNIPSAKELREIYEECKDGENNKESD